MPQDVAREQAPCDAPRGPRDAGRRWMDCEVQCVDADVNSDDAAADAGYRANGVYLEAGNDEGARE